MASAGPRYFGFVIGGSVDAALVADVLAVGWDQCAFNAALSPAALAFEDVAGSWLKELLAHPRLGVGRLRHRRPGGEHGRAGRRALAGAAPARLGRRARRPPRRAAGAGSGWGRAARDDRPGASAARSRRERAGGGAGDAGRRDGFRRARGRARIRAGRPDHRVRAGRATSTLARATTSRRSVPRPARQAPGCTWTAPSGSGPPRARARTRSSRGSSSPTRGPATGTSGSTSRTTPATLFCADPNVHATAMAYTASYLTGQVAGRAFGGGDFVPESSRRARGFATWAAIRSLGRTGVADLVDRCCRLARRFAGTARRARGRRGRERRGAQPGAGPSRRRAISPIASSAGVQEDGTCWLGATTWRGERLLRISVSNWSTTEADVDLVCRDDRQAARRSRRRLAVT